MRKHFLIYGLICMGVCVSAAERKIISPDGRLRVIVADADGKPTYSVTYDNDLFLSASPLGMKSNIDNFISGLSIGESFRVSEVENNYSLPNIKKSNVKYNATRATVPFQKDGKTVFEVEFSVSDNDVAFRYVLHSQ